MTQWSVESRLNHVLRYLVNAANMAETKIELKSRLLKPPPRHMCTALLNARVGSFVAKIMACIFLPFINRAELC
jgi:hypothetical protein